jgi:phosphohistidine phosphatase
VRTITLRRVTSTLWLLRHGEAVPHGSRPDAERELTPKGERQSRVAGEALARLNVEFDACYASPKIRALDTAKLACASLGVQVVEAASVEGDFGTRDAGELLRAHGEDACVLVVGHNPDFEQVVHDLTGARVDFKKGGVAAVRMRGSSRGDLIVLLRPAELEAIAAT